MTAKISIPVSYIFFPITLPIALVRRVLALVVGVVIIPVWLVTWMAAPGYESGFGYKKTLTLLNTTVKDSDSAMIRFDVHEVRVSPGFVSRIAGAKPLVKNLWMARGGRWGQIFLEDGTAVDRDSYLVKGVQDLIEKERTQRSIQKAQQRNLEMVQTAKAIKE